MSSELFLLIVNCKSLSTPNLKDIIHSRNPMNGLAVQYEERDNQPNDHGLLTTTKPQHQVQSTLFLNVIIR